MIIERIESVAGQLSTNRYLGALRDGIILCMPLIIIGSVFLIVGNFPVTSWSVFLKTHEIDTWLDKIVNGSFGIIGLIAAFSIAYNLTNSWSEDGVSSGVISLSSYLILTPYISGGDTHGYPLLFLGSKGIFAAILVSIITARIFHFFLSRNIVIKMPDGVPPAVTRSFLSLIPGFVTILFFGIIYIVLLKSGLDNIHVFLAEILNKPLGFLGGTLPGTIIAVILNSLFWIIGIHPGGTINAVMNPVWLMNTDQNRLALSAGQDLPNIITQPFMDNFVWMGGGGATIGLVICLFLFSRSRQNKTLGALAFIPGLFNINEPVIFGLPIVLNLKMAIPFILSPVAIAIVTWFAMASGIVHKPIGVSMPWTMPPIISGYFATGGHISGSVIQIIGIVVSTLIYYPFFTLVDKQQFNAETKDG
ncbi:PTS cellobiose transporter subunit IIC [Salmonella enterica subsp. enterica serovar Morehead]|nr:PTS cellobiose transporter subunit IIC [Salmonella enterica subsp. enterica serovar Newport]EBY2753087.1 PTS cellobiose transporter subunit IIC [Salmonella enterica subsp. enterica serovar Kottbus]EEM2539453.1 PTS cellobiose transporter subunit IIC [Salmonella enterica subsp. enterica serovar Morehead]EHN5888772.1 PTS cellobiose transporter subunit IIC [Salmonella enterica subsp. enterica serovar Newport]